MGKDVDAGIPETSALGLVEHVLQKHEEIASCLSHFHSSAHLVCASLPGMQLLTFSTVQFKSQFLGHNFESA